MTAIGCVSVSGCHAPLELLERLAYTTEQQAIRLPALRTNCRAGAVAVLSTCQRTELYASWAGEADVAALTAALASDRGVPVHVLDSAVTTYLGDSAARHLLRVATGLESFVLGEREILGQVRDAADVSRAAGGRDVVLDRLMGAAIRAARQTHRQTSLAAAGRSVATAAVDALIGWRGAPLAGRRLLVVGAGQVAAAVVDRAAELGAVVTVCNRTRRRADRFLAAGVSVVDLAALAHCLATTDIAIMGTAAPHPLVDAEMLRSIRSGRAQSLTLVDLSLPRNVDPSVREEPRVRLFDLADLHAAGSREATSLVEDVAATERVVEDELARYLGWLSSRSAAASVSRMRADAEHVVREEMAKIADGLPADVRPSVERALLRAAHRLAHGPTRELIAAAQAGDHAMVELLAGLYDRNRPANVRVIRSAASVLAADDPDAATRLLGPSFHPQRREPRTEEQPSHERSVHSTNELAV